MTARIMVIDDHPVVIEGIRYALSSTSDIKMVGSITRLEAWVQQLLALQPGVLVTEVRLDEQDLLREFELNSPASTRALA